MPQQGEFCPSPAGCTEPGTSQSNVITIQGHGDEPTPSGTGSSRLWVQVAAPTIDQPIVYADQAADSQSTGVPVMGVTKHRLRFLTDGDYTPLTMDKNGAVYTTLVDGSGNPAGNTAIGTELRLIQVELWILILLGAIFIRLWRNRA